MRQLSYTKTTWEKRTEREFVLLLHLILFVYLYIHLLQFCGLQNKLCIGIMELYPVLVYIFSTKLDN